MEIDEELVRRIVNEKTRASFWIGLVTGLALGAIAGYAIGVYTATDNVTVITWDKGIQSYTESSPFNVKSDASGNRGLGFSVDKANTFSY